MLHGECGVVMWSMSAYQMHVGFIKHLCARGFSLVWFRRWPSFLHTIRDSFNTNKLINYGIYRGLTCP